MTMLTYTLITDPAPLAASEAGRQSKSMGTVYLLVTNTGQQAAFWSTIEVEVPVGNGAGDLTSDFNKVRPEGEYGPRSGTRSSVNVQPGPQGSNAFQATAPGGRTPFAPGDYMVLTLANVAVAPTAGLAVLRVTENAGRTKTGRLSKSFAAVALVKTTPKEIPAPHSFLADNAVVDAGTKVTLSWEGSDDFTYEILFPGGRKPVPQVKHTGSHGPYSVVLDASDAPKRDTTYTLIASFGTQRHTFTTTVQVRNPILETLTAINGVTTPWVQGASKGDGAFTFSQGAMHVRHEFGSQEGGALYAGEATVSGVATEYVKGLKDGDGDITFLPGGVKVWRTRGSNDPGTLYAGEATVSGVATGEVIADRITVNRVNTERVQGKANTGSLTFTADGVEVSNNSGGQGAVLADRIAVNRVNTERVQGKSTGDGWITFPYGGIQVACGAYYDTPRLGYVFAQTICLNQSFSGEEENRWIDLSDGGEVSVKHRGTDGMTSYGSLKVSRVDTDFHRW
ncbi:hypothetical protein AB0J28_15440 [Streptosporangium canum]|uniref:hypothetical protein n=1 Tax=Streptosporangium canum TaxID=324952 RepID=UPI003446387D